MATGDYVEVLPDSTGKKVEARQLSSDTDIVFRQIVDLGDNRGVDILTTMGLLIEEAQKTRRVLCQIGNVNYEE